MAHPNSHHENNNGGFMADSQTTTNDKSQQSQSSGFVGKVRSLLSTSTLTKWFSHTPTANRTSHIRPRTEMEADDSSNDSDDDSEDYNQEQPKVVLQPPAKRLKTTINLPTTSSIFAESASTSVSNNNSRLRAINSFSVDVTMRNPKRLVLNRRNNLNLVQQDSTTTTIQNDSDDSGESTSGYSSMPRLTQINMQEERKPLIQDQQQQEDSSRNATTTSTAHTSSSTLINLHNRSLFDTSHDRSLFQSTTPPTFAFNTTTAGRPTSLSTRRPAFSGANLSNATNINSLNTSATSITTVNSGSGLLDRTIATRRIYNSPFYSGRTLYGGASNLSMGRCFNQLQGAGTAVENKNKDTDVRDSTSTTMLSSTARRILDTLESYTLDTTKKMPNTNKNRRQLRQDHLFAASSAKPYNRMGNRILNDLQVPNVAQLLRMKERLQTQTVQVRQMMQQQQQQHVADSHTSTAATSTAVGGKIRTKVTASARQHKQLEVGLEEDNTEERLSSIQLPISALPTFTDLYLPLPNLIASCNSIKTMITSTTGISTTTSTISTSSINTAGRTVAPTTTAPSIVAVSISTPHTLAKAAFVSTTVAAVRSVTMTSDTSTSSLSSTAISSAVKNVDAAVEKIQPQEIDNKHELSDQMFIFAKPLVLLDSGLNGSKLRNITAINNFKFSVPLNQMLTHKINKSISSSPPTTTTTTMADRVDSSCAVNMAADIAKPPAKVIVASTNTGEKTPKGFGAEFKLSASVQWECNVCLVRNSSSAAICVACTSPKHKPSDNATVGTSGWGGIFKLPSNRWECNVCLVSNVNDSTRCVACETLKPGAVASASSSARGAKSSATWECSSCMVKNQSTARKCVCCETLQPGVNTTVGGSSTGNNLVTKYNFGITPIALSAVSTVSTSSTNAAPSGFTFGIPPSSVTKTTATVGISSSTITTGSGGGANMGGTIAIPVGFTFGIPAATTTACTVTAVVPITVASSVNNNGSSSSTVSSTTTLNQQQPQKPLPNGMISSSSGGSSSTFVTLVAPGTSSTTNTATTSTSSSTITSAPTINATAMLGIKFGSPLGATTGTASNLFAFGRPSAAPSPVPTQDVSSSTSSSNNTKGTNQPPPPNSKTLIAAAATVVATPTTTSSGSFVSSTAVANAGAAPSNFAPPTTPFQSKVAPVPNLFAFAFNKPTVATEASATSVTAATTVAPTTVPIKKQAPVFGSGSTAAAASASSSTISTTIQQQQSNGPFMFGGAAAAAAAAAAATVAPTASSHAGLFSFGAAAGNNAQSSNASTPSFGFGSQTSANTTAQPPMNFINALGGNANLFGQPNKMKNGGFDFSASLATKPSFQPSTAGFNFTPPGSGTVTAAQPSHRALFSFGGSYGSGTGAPAGGANGAAAPFTFGAVSSSSSNNNGRNKQSITPQPLSFGGITSAASSTTSASPHTNIFGTPTPSSATTDNSLGGGGGTQIQQQRRIIKKAIRRTNTQPR